MKRNSKVWRWVWLALLVFVVGSCTLTLTSCSATITRPEVRQSQASHTSTGQDSGILSEAKDGFIVNQEWIDGYRSLLKKYGHTLSPPRDESDSAGIVKVGENRYRVSDAAVERQLAMNSRRVNDQAP